MKKNTIFIALSLLIASSVQAQYIFECEQIRVNDTSRIGRGPRLGYQKIEIGLRCNQLPTQELQQACYNCLTKNTFFYRPSGNRFPVSGFRQ